MAVARALGYGSRVGVRIRVGDVEDAADVAAIYASYVRETPITFETEPPSPREFADRLRGVLAFHPWLVCAIDGRVVGYAYARRYHERAAYRWTAEVAIYVAAVAHRRGVGRALYTALLSALRRQGLRLAFAGITMPNPASVALHEGFGFRSVGLARAMGNKFDAWHDVGWWTLDLQPLPDAPPEPRSFGVVAAEPAWDATCRDAAALVRG